MYGGTGGIGDTWPISHDGSTAHGCLQIDREVSRGVITSQVVSLFLSLGRYNGYGLIKKLLKGMLKIGLNRKSCYT